MFGKGIVLANDICIEEEEKRNLYITNETEGDLIEQKRLTTDEEPLPLIYMKKKSIINCKQVHSSSKVAKPKRKC